MQLSVIIVNYNVKYFLEQCLCSVLKACANISAEIIVVDNSSTDGSKEYFSNRFLQVRFIWKNENAGFAKANNEALKIATGEKILFLNPDTIVAEDCFEKSLDFFSAKNNIGAVGFHMIDGSGKYLPESKRGFPSVFVSFCKMAGLTALFPQSKLLAKYYLGHLPENKINEVDVLAGACMMVEKKVVDITGPFDESFFMYGEDIDLSYRIQKSGYKNFYFPDVSIIHFKGESTQKNSLQYLKKFYGAMSLFVQKHYKGNTAFLYNAVIHSAIWLKAFIAGIKGIFKKGSAVNISKEANTAILIVAGKEEFKKIVLMISKYSPAQIITGRVSPGNTAESDSIGNIKELENSVNQNAVKEIIFCQNGFTFKEMISIIQQLPAGIIYKFHAAGTYSIVSSASKNSAGAFIAFND